MKNALKNLFLLITLIAISVSCNKSKVVWKLTPPIPGLETAFESYTIDASTVNSLKVGFDTKIDIPANAFVDADGNTVSGKVDIKYREFHKGTDIFLSGIPMSYQSQGETKAFETAGMFELQAFQKGKQLDLADSKSINVKFGSKYAGDDYSLFELNSETGQWEWVDIPTTEVNIEKQTKIEAMKSKLPAVKIPLSDNYFILNYDRLVDIYFSNNRLVAQNNFKNKTLRNKFEEYGIKFNNVNAEGEILFGKAYYHPAEMVWNDLDGKEFPKQLANFEFKWVERVGKWVIGNYSIKSQGNNKYKISYYGKGISFSKEMEAFMPIKSLLKLPVKTWTEEYDKAMKLMEEDQKEVDLMAEAYRSFRVNNMGIYNCDRLLKDNNWFPVAANFTINNVQEKTNQLILIFGDNSGSITFAPEQFASIKINPESKHRMFMIMPNQELAVFPVEKLKNISSDSLRAIQNPTYTFIMQNKGKVKDAVSFRQQLGLE